MGRTIPREASRPISEHRRLSQIAVYRSKPIQILREAMTVLWLFAFELRYQLAIILRIRGVHEQDLRDHF
jgi:hypothetical protein